jgi:cytochrome c55X
MIRTAVIMLAVSLAVGLGAAQAQASGLTGERIAELKGFVDQDCGSCHGLTRKGGLGSPLDAQTMRQIGDEALVATILDGRPGTPMPPWRALISEDEARWIVHYLKGQEQ